MLKHPTLDKLEELRLDGMARALREQMEMPETYAGMTFDERLGLLVDREDVDRANRVRFGHLHLLPQSPCHPVQAQLLELVECRMLQHDDTRW